MKRRIVPCTVLGVALLCMASLLVPREASACDSGGGGGGGGHPNCPVPTLSDIQQCVDMFTGAAVSDVFSGTIQDATSQDRIGVSFHKGGHIWYPVRSLVVY